MANTCTNKFYAEVKENSVEKSQKILNEFLTELAENVEILYSDIDDTFTEIEFESRWTYPHDDIQKIVKNIVKKYQIKDGEIYIRCLSYEFGCEYVEYVTYNQGTWSNNILA